MKAPSPNECGQAARALKAAASCELNEGDTERAEILQKAAEIMDAKAFVGAVSEIYEELGEKGIERLARVIGAKKRKTP